MVVRIWYFICWSPAGDTRWVWFARDSSCLRGSCLGHGEKNKGGPGNLMGCPVAAVVLQGGWGSLWEPPSGPFGVPCVPCVPGGGVAGSAWPACLHRLCVTEGHARQDCRVHSLRTETCLGEFLTFRTLVLNGWVRGSGRWPSQLLGSYFVAGNLWDKVN